MTKQVPRLRALSIDGYGPFRNFKAPIGDIEVIAGANGSGKSSLFEFLRFIRDAVARPPIPPEIVKGSIGRQIFYRPGDDSLSWSLDVQLVDATLQYSGSILGPLGSPNVINERVECLQPKPDVLLREKPNGTIEFPGTKHSVGYGSHRRELALARAIDGKTGHLTDLRETISSWSFYNSFHINTEKLRGPALVQENPALEEDLGNLSSVLHCLFMEHRSAFDKLKSILKSTVPGFKDLAVRARGAPGYVTAFWEEDVVDQPLTLADLSDGTLCLLCWATLCVMPNVPPLVCIDEPDQGIHPRALPMLAGLFEAASSRCQFLLATHSSYFLRQFDLEHVAVMRKVAGRSEFHKPADSAALKANLEDFGPDELDAMHRNDELEALS